MTAVAATFERPQVLYITHRVPYPPDKGDRIRNYHVLRQLSANARVKLASLTDEPIPDALIRKLHEARLFNQGYETVRYAASALVDLAAHALTTEQVPDVADFERAELARIGAPAVVGMNHRLVHFQHLFAGSGYAAQYYVYLWAEVLEADGFEAFVEAGSAFDPAVAERLRRFIYSSGNSLEPGAAYRAFRGRGPTALPMLRQRGLAPQPS